MSALPAQAIQQAQQVALFFFAEARQRLPGNGRSDGHQVAGQFMPVVGQLDQAAAAVAGAHRDFSLTYYVPIRDSPICLRKL